MTMNRREFVKRAGMVSAAVAVVPLVMALPALPEKKIHPQYLPRPRTGNIVTHKEPWLPISMMLRAHSMAWYGKDAPTLVLMSALRMEEFKSKIHPTHLRSSGSRDFYSVRFQDADVAVGSQVPNDEIWFINENMPDVPKLQAILKLGVA